MTIMEHKWSALPVPYAMEVLDRVRKERYFDPDFYRLEAELLWPRVWQMACRLEEIPEPGDFAEYEILDQSVIVVRTEDLGVRAFHNVCRHRGVRVAQGRGSRRGGFVCPFHGWCYGTDGRNTRVTQARAFSEHNLRTGRPRPDPGAVRGVGRLCLDQPRRRRAAAASVHRAVRHRARRLEGRVARGPSGGTPAASRSTGSWPRRRSSSSTTCSRPTPSCGSRAATRPRARRLRSTRVRRRRSCSTCGR